MSTNLAIKEGGGISNGAYAHFSPSGEEYQYLSGENTWIFKKPSGKSLASICIMIFVNENRLSGYAYCFYWTREKASTRYAYIPGSTAEISRADIAYPATRQHRLGFSETASEVTVSFFETGTPTASYNGDIMLVFE